jgi:alkylation response protein AidB-like acyl-CoA dehydrogenase
MNVSRRVNADTPGDMHAPASDVPAFPFTREQIALASAVGAFAEKHFAPIAQRWDRENSFPRQNYEMLKAEGWLRIPVSRRFGGMGCGLHENPLAWVLVVQQLSKACGNTGQTFQIWGHCMSMIEELATPDQAARLTREAMTGAIWCSGGSEPSNYTQKRQTPATTAKVGATTENTAKARTTLARQVEGGVRVTGRKLFISNSSVADRFFIFADLISPEGRSLGLVHPVVERGAAGLRVEPSWDAMGMRGTASDDLVLEDVFVPNENVIGLQKPNAYFTSVLAGSFLVGRAAVYMGIADAAFEFLVRYVRDRIKAGDDAVMQYRVGQLETHRQAAASTLYRAAWQWQEAIVGGASPSDCASFAAMTHTSVSEAALKITNEAIELCGGRGMLRSSPLERYHRDVRAYSVSPPTASATMINLGSRLLAPLEQRETLVGEGV